VAVLALVAAVLASRAVGVVHGLHRETVAGPAAIDRDLYLWVPAVEVSATVGGDLVVGAGLLDALGTTEGNLNVLGGRLESRGPVRGGVRAAGGSVAIYGRVDGDVVVVGGSVTVAESASIGGDLIVAAGTVRAVDGSVIAGAVLGAAVNLTIEGIVGGDVRVAVDHLEIGPGAKIYGGVRYESRNLAGVAGGARIAKGIERRDPWRRLPLASVSSWGGGAVPRTAMMLFAGGLLVLLLPGSAAAVADGGRAAPLATALVGLAAALALPIAAVVLALTVAALPIVVIGLAGVSSVVYLSQAIVGLTIGRALFGAERADVRRKRLLVSMACGIGLVAAPRLVPLPGINVGLALATALFGLGAVVSALWPSLRQPGSGDLGEPDVRHDPLRTLAWAACGCAIGLLAFTVALVGLGTVAVALVVMAAQSSRLASVELPLPTSWVAAFGAAAIGLAVGLTALGVWLWRLR
jgi:hypothetical protein